MFFTKDEMRIISLASGSSGNCYLISAEGKNFLVDCGISARKITTGLADLGIAPETLDAVFITHEHTDHISGVFVLSKRLGMPVYMTPKTYYAVKASRKIENLRFFTPEERFSHDKIEILPFRVPHDAADPVGYKFFTDEGDIVVATDCGKITDGVASAIDGARALVLESNHDKKMLECGPYPPHLKVRIAGEFGHLSNAEAATLLCNMNRSNLSALLLGHLSRSNNLPNIVMDEALSAFGGDFHTTAVQIGDQFAPRELRL
ncbi:MAG TPA: MBL fold metallo-hydrolase [candidate division Zixibacteria bacterium]|nr:MBL fold metallo-hydrolase [candidate division Zixibacteria bacterium]